MMQMTQREEEIPAPCLELWIACSECADSLARLHACTTRVLSPTFLHKGLCGGDIEVLDSISRGFSAWEAGFQKASFLHCYIPLDGRGLKNMSVMTLIEKRNVLSYLRFMPRGRNPVTLVAIMKMGPTPTFCVWDLSSHRGPTTHTRNLCLI